MNNPIPAGKDGLIPHLTCSPCKEAIDFYKRAFGAEELGCMPAMDGQKVMHAELSIEGQPLFLADDFPEYCAGASKSPQSLGGSPVTIHRYVKDCDAAIRRAQEAGATVTMPAADMFWGDRYGVITDPFGHVWAFATHKTNPTPEQMQQAMQDMFQQQGENA